MSSTRLPLQDECNCFAENAHERTGSIQTRGVHSCDEAPARGEGLHKRFESRCKAHEYVVFILLRMPTNSNWEENHVRNRLGGIGKRSRWKSTGPGSGVDSFPKGRVGKNCCSEFTHTVNRLLTTKYQCFVPTFPSCIVVSTHVAPLDEQSTGQLRKSSAIRSVALATPKLDSTTRFGILAAHLRLTRWPSYEVGGKSGKDRGHTTDGRQVGQHLSESGWSLLLYKQLTLHFHYRHLRDIPYPIPICSTNQHQPKQERTSP